MAANNKEVTGWYAELLWIEGFMGGLLDDLELDPQVENQIKYCRKRLEKLKLTMLKEGLKNVNEEQIISTFHARTPSTFRLSKEDV
jgi:hypothetical protein